MLNPQDERFKKFIDKLSQDSWQLELIISAFSIFGLNSLSNYLDETHNSVRFLYTETSATIFISAISAFVSIILFGLIVHVFVRGLWIAMLGLNFMGGDYDHDYLNYQPKFSNFLKKNLKPLNHYIHQLEMYASSIFGLTFLFAFQLFFFFSTVLIIQIIADFFINNNTSDSKIFGFVFLAFLLFVFFVNLIDFILLGWFKKNRWTAKIYYPFYRLYSWLSFSFLYRPILYKLIDNKAGKRIMTLSLIGFIAFFFFGSSSYRPLHFIDNYDLDNYNSLTYTHDELYKENFTEKDFVSNLIINKQVINENNIELYFRHKVAYEDTLRKYFPKLIDKENDKRGIDIFSPFKRTINSKSKKTFDLYMSSFNKMYYVQIDSIKYKSDFILNQLQNEQLVYFSALPTKDLVDGKHILYVMYQNKKKIDTLGIVPFWYYKN
jgi:hypothetical protein